MYAFGIMAGPAVAVREHVVARVADFGYRLDADGEVRDGGGQDIGVRWQIVGPEAFAARPWHQVSHPCPFVAPLAGYLVLEPSTGDLIDHHSLRFAALCRGRGVIARVADDHAVQAVVRRCFDLSFAFGKFGFEDGDALLDHDDLPYRDHVLAAVEQALAAAGFAAQLGWASTTHNPLWICTLQRAPGGPSVPALWRIGDERPLAERVVPVDALYGREVEIWSFDFEVLDDEDFWTWP